MLFLIGQYIQANRLVPPALRRMILTAMGFQLGQRVRIKGAVSFFTNGTSFGDRSFVNFECFFDASAPITIGAQVHIGPRVMLITGSHAIGGPEKRGAGNTAAPIVIGDGSWIGAGAIILPGVTVGPGCVIAAGSVVVSDTDADTVYAGVPARKIRPLDVAPRQ